MNCRSSIVRLFSISFIERLLSFGFYALRRRSLRPRAAINRAHMRTFPTILSDESRNPRTEVWNKMNSNPRFGWFGHITADCWVGRLLRLAFLAPPIVDAIADGHQPPDLTMERLTRRIMLPLDWNALKRLLASDSARG